MDVLRDQVMALSRKVDAIYEIVEQINSRVSDQDSESSLPEEKITPNKVKMSAASKASSPSGYSRFDAALEHKDVLVDDNSWDKSQSREGEWTAEIQIQRLTAQLTAAYNRIAALEEQLLANRIHTSESVSH